MSTDQRMLPSEGRVNYMGRQASLQSSPEFDPTRHLHELIDAILAAVLGAEAGLSWLRAQPPDMDEVRNSLDHAISNGKRAGEIVVRLRAFLNAGNDCQ